MSVETIMDLPFTPESRTHEILVPTIGTSRSGDIFVTNNADSLIFVCSHCQKATKDIDDFICHIKISHPTSLQGLPMTYVPAPMISIPVPMSSISVIDSVIPVEEQTNAGNLNLENEHSSNSVTICSKVSKIVDISLLTDNNGTENLLSNKNSILTSYPSQELNEETSKQQPDSHFVQENNEVTFGNNTSQAQQESICIDDDDDKGSNDSDSGSVYSPSGENSDDSNVIDSETNEDYKASGSKQKIKHLQHTCGFCNRSFEYKRSLDIHIKKHHKEQLEKKPPPKTSKCKKCGKSFRTAYALQEHINTHDKKKYQNHPKCPICQDRQVSANNFFAHVMTHESDTCFPCQVCGKMNSTKDERTEHWKTHEEELPFHCDICYRRFRKRYYLNIHLKSHFQYQCQFCPDRFIAVRVQKRPYVCPKCENIPEIKERIDLQRILESNHHIFESDEDLLSSDSDDANEDLGGTTSVHKCEFCSMTFKSQQGVVQHIVLSHDRNYRHRFPFKCRQCNEGFKSRSGLCFHERTHDKSRKFCCPVCELSYFRENDFVTHVMTHKSELCFPCQVCGKIFPNNNEREKHYKTHIKELPYGCDYCYRRFLKKHTLLRHLKIHGQYKCSLCTKDFTSNENPLKPYYCPSCK